LHKTRTELTGPSRSPVLVVAFTAPKVYEQNQAQIDHALRKAQVELRSLYVKAKEQVVKTIDSVPALAKLFGRKSQ